MRMVMLCMVMLCMVMLCTVMLCMESYIKGSGSVARTDTLNYLVYLCFRI